MLKLHATENSPGRLHMLTSYITQLEMQDGDTLEVHQEQVGGYAQ